MSNTDLKPLDPDETRFGFGENWSEYSAHIEDQHIQNAVSGMSELLSAGDIKGKTFLDIGSGSGLHSLAALKKGAKFVTAIDLDPQSVETTRAVLNRFWSEDNYQTEQASILEDGDILGAQYDIVYSWGVLHHTGGMWDAIARASSAVKDNGLFVLALYKKTPLCNAWTFEKKIYSSLPKILRFPIDYIYALFYCLGLLLTGKNPVNYIKEYSSKRGMLWMTDVRDWLGGYPYESVSPKEIERQMNLAGFTLEKSINDGPAAVKGLFGTGCGEYVFRKKK